MSKSQSLQNASRREETVALVSQVKTEKKDAVLSSSSNLKKVDNKLREAPHKFNHLPKRRPCNIEFNGLSYFVPEGSIFRDKGFKTILKSVSGSFTAGQMTAVMGPSGAGKSTLLNILAGYKALGTRGEVLVNGKPRDARKFRKMSCYIMQDDQLLPHLTVWEAMMVLCLMKSLAMGGRTIICTIHQPSARLFEMFDQLYILGSGQCIYNGTVPGLVPFLNAHDLICPQYHNPADYVIEVASGEFGDVTSVLISSVRKGLCDSYQNAHIKSTPDFYEQIGTQVDSVLDSTGALKIDHDGGDSSVDDDDDFHDGFNTSSLYQFWILLLRCLRCIMRDQMLTQLRFISHVLIGGAIGLLYMDIGDKGSMVQQNISLIFLVLLFLLFSALMPTVLTFPTEMNVFVREHMNYWYSLKSYFMAKTFADLPFQIVFPAIFCVICWFMSGQPNEWDRFFIFYVISTLTSLVAQSLGLLIGAAAPQLEVATFMGPVACVPLLLFAGFFIKNDAIPVYLRWCSYTSFVRYSFEGSLISVYGEVNGKIREKVPCEFEDDFFGNNPHCPIVEPEVIMDHFSAKPTNLGLDCAMLIVFFIALRIIAYLALKVKLSLHNDNLLTHTRYFFQQLKSEGVRAAFGCDRSNSSCCC